MEQYNYRVEFEVFTERHYIKNFRKNYKNRWLDTEQVIVFLCERIDNMLRSSKADLISFSGSYKLVKLDFAVAGTRISPKASGNRCILLIDETAHLARILLVYSKNDISQPNETEKWKKLIRDNFPDIANIFEL